MYWNILNMLDGEKPEVRFPEQRREIDVLGQLAEAFPEIVSLREDFKNGGGTIHEEYFRTSRGLDLFSRTVVPPGTLRGGVLFCHGYTDNIQWHARKVLLEFANLGYLATAVEIEGHGLSDGLSAFVPDFGNSLKDTNEYLASKREEFPGLKWFVMGESMGGMFALKLCLLEQEKGTPFDGAILIAPMCKIAEEVKPPAPLINSLLFLAKYFPTLSVTPSDIRDELVFKDKTFTTKASLDPIKYVGRPRLATASAMYNATISLETRMHEMKTPFIVLHGKKDIITTHEASVDLYEAASVPEKDKKLILDEEAWHGILWAEEEEAMKKHWAAIFEWVDSRL